ncbi:MAG TPA: tRNA (adenine(22)-N(1))-methyltransferase TrmK [Candidatus Dormibacteraeota bacterium]
MSRRLPPRLEALLRLVPADANGVADVGAGHGALSAAQAQRGWRVIATEARPGPFDELRRNLARWNVSTLVDARQGSGLEPIAAGEVDTAIVAGMGGHTVLGIADGAAGRGIPRLLLQCMQRDELVAPWIAARGFAAVDRAEVTDRGRQYAAWLVRVAPGE